jgi:hypothetical protein
MFRPLRAMLRDPETKVLVMAALIVIAVGTVGYMLIEGWTALQAVYFCVVTLATVGFGDLHPTTELGQLFTIGYIITGVGIIAAFISQLAEHRTFGRDTIARRIADDVDGTTEDEPRSS